MRLLENSAGTVADLETDRVPDDVAELHVHLVRHATGDAHRRHSSGLRTRHAALEWGGGGIKGGVAKKESSRMLWWSQ